MLTFKILHFLSFSKIQLFSKHSKVIIYGHRFVYRPERSQGICRGNDGSERLSGKRLSSTGRSSLLSWRARDTGTLIQFLHVISLYTVKYLYWVTGALEPQCGLMSVPVCLHYICPLWGLGWVYRGVECLSQVPILQFFDTTRVALPDIHHIIILIFLLQSLLRPSLF